MKPLRTHTHAKHRNGAKVAALVAAALLAASTAGCAEVSQSLRGIDNAIAVALGGQPQGGDYGSDGEGEYWLPLCDENALAAYDNARAYVLAQKNLNAAIPFCDEGGDGFTVGTYTPLTAVAEMGNARDIKTLLARGANINAPDPDGYTPLMRAAARNVQPLLASGADVNATGSWGDTALSLTKNERDERRRRDDAEGVQEDENVIRILQEAGAKEHPIAEGAADAFGNTALMLAAKQGDTKEMQRLIAAGADVNAANQAGNTALLIAARAGKTNAVKTLLDKGANVNAANQAGSTALLEAVQAGETSAVKALLAKGANVNAVNREGDTALLKAAGDLKAEIVKLLLAKGANVHARDKQGQTALQRAEMYAEVMDPKAVKKTTDALKSAGKKGAKKRK